MTSAEACVKKVEREAKLGPADLMGVVCPKGSFFDLIRGGECRPCPKGYRSWPGWA